MNVRTRCFHAHSATLSLTGDERFRIYRGTVTIEVDTITVRIDGDTKSTVLGRTVADNLVAGGYRVRADGSTGRTRRSTRLTVDELPQEILADALVDALTGGCEDEVEAVAR